MTRCAPCHDACPCRERYFADLLASMGCGHPTACVSTADEGTSYCRWCEEVAQLRAALTDAPADCDVDALRVQVTILTARCQRLEAAVIELQGHHCAGPCDETQHERVMQQVNAALDAARG